MFGLRGRTRRGAYRPQRTLLRIHIPKPERRRRARDDELGGLEQGRAIGVGERALLTAELAAVGAAGDDVKDQVLLPLDTHFLSRTFMRAADVHGELGELGAHRAGQRARVEAASLEGRDDDGRRVGAGHAPRERGYDEPCSDERPTRGHRALHSTVARTDSETTRY